MVNELGSGITKEIKENFTGSLQLCSTSPFRFFEKYPTGISVSQHHITGTANGHGNCKEFEYVIYHTKLVIYMLEEIQENLLT
jgi:hypothetical protein